MIYVQKLRNMWETFWYGEDSFAGYTVDPEAYTAITEEDYESVTPLSSPNVINNRK
jgi:hypothetical protein